MKVTKEMLAELRHSIVEPQSYSIHHGDLAVLSIGLLQALIDERKALREALKACLPVGPHAEEMRDLALLGGEDE